MNELKHNFRSRTNHQKAIHLQKKARIEARGQAKMAIKTAFQKGKCTGKQAKKTVSWMNQSQDMNPDDNEAWQDEPESSLDRSNESITGRNVEVVSSMFAEISM